MSKRLLSVARLEDYAEFLVKRPKLEPIDFPIPFELCFELCMQRLDLVDACALTCKGFLEAFCSETYLTRLMNQISEVGKAHGAVHFYTLPHFLTTTYPRDWIRNKLPPISWDLSTAKQWSSYLRSKLVKRKRFFVTGGTICQAVYHKDWNADFDVWKSYQVLGRDSDQPLTLMETFEQYENEMYTVASWRFRLGLENKESIKHYTGCSTSSSEDHHEIVHPPRYKIDVIRLDKDKECYQCLQGFDLSIVMNGKLFSKGVDYSTPLALFTQMTNIIVITRFICNLEGYEDTPWLTTKIQALFVYAVCQHCCSQDGNHNRSFHHDDIFEECTACKQLVTDRFRHRNNGILEEEWKKFLTNMLTAKSGSEIHQGSPAWNMAERDCYLLKPKLDPEIYEMVILYSMEWQICSARLSILRGQLQRWCGRIRKYAIRFPSYQWQLYVPARIFEHGFPLMAKYMSSLLEMAISSENKL